MDISLLRKNYPDHWTLATAIRVLTLDAVAKAKSGHSGMPMGMADVATVLFKNHMRFDPAVPNWSDRDRFILSAGHGSMLLYSLLYLTGYPDMTLTDLKNFRQLGAKTAGHPEFGFAGGIETTTGPLGQGLANAVGFAVAEEHLRARFGKNLVSHFTYVIAGDGCLMEGVSQEAISLAGRQQLSKMIVFWDNNNITIDGEVGITDRTNQRLRFEASGWHVQEVNGHDPNAIDRAIRIAKNSAKPSMIACKTHIALGSAAQDTPKGHGALTDADLITQTRQAYGWPYPSFEIPKEVLENWANIGRRGARDRLAWDKRLEQTSSRKRKEFQRSISGQLPINLSNKIGSLKKQLFADSPEMATREASQVVLETINHLIPESFGGSADLTGSNNTLTKDLTIFSPENRIGRYIYYGIREHGMAAAMNGMALHGGIKPYGGTFMCFTDYARGALRLSALMQQSVTYVMTHDSIGLGEDGPTHQPVEHLSMLRATPNINVFRPADAIETAEAWELAINASGTPSVLALSRQKLKTVRTKHTRKNQVSLGAYILAEAVNKRKAILMATGSEVGIALLAKKLLEDQGVGVRVVSMPCWELFEAQDQSYRRKVLPSGPVRVAIEAGVNFGWDKWLLGEKGKSGRSAFIGMEGFGASAPADELYKHFSITPQSIAKRVLELIS
ncbi:MAG: transketolase [Paracoccaceae bacterium]